MFTFKILLSLKYYYTKKKKKSLHVHKHIIIFDLGLFNSLV